jgi:excisionase family DNA binding protein
MNDAKAMMTATELAELLRLRPDTIRLWTREGIIPAIRAAFGKSSEGA